MAESTTFTGNIDSSRAAGTYTTAYQRLTSQDKYSAAVRFACFTKNPFTRAIGVEGFGVESMKNLQAFGSAKPTGNMVRYESGRYGFSHSIFATTGTSYHTGRMGSRNPELVEGGDESVWSWHQLNNSQYIPENDVDDNGQPLIPIRVLKERNMKEKFVGDFNMTILGSSSAPDYGTLGASVVYHDLPNLISVDQTRTVGGIATTNSFWANGYKAVTSVGGGGEMDRPITLRRSMMDQTNDQMTYGEATDQYLYLCTQGAYQYYDRLMYADAIQGGQGGVFASYAKYDAAGIPNKAFNGRPLIWDSSVTVPYASSAVTAGTEAIYGIHIPDFGICIRKEKNFKFSGWEPPRAHDQYATYVAHLELRYTPYVLSRRAHFVLYNIPANAD